MYRTSGVRTSRAESDVATVVLFLLVHWPLEPHSHVNVCESLLDVMIT